MYVIYVCYTVCMLYCEDSHSFLELHHSVDTLLFHEFLYVLYFLLFAFEISVLQAKKDLRLTLMKIFAMNWL